MTGKTRSKVRIEKSTRTRQAIIDACHYDILTIRQIADKLDIPCQGINIHLLNLVEDGYLSKHERVARVNGQWSCGYTSISDQPYVWRYRNQATVVDEEPLPEQHEQPLDIDIALAIKLGYTNIVPSKGRVHQGLMSNNGNKWAVNE